MHLPRVLLLIRLSNRRLSKSLASRRRLSPRRDWPLMLACQIILLLVFPSRSQTRLSNQVSLVLPLVSIRRQYRALSHHRTSMYNRNRHWDNLLQMPAILLGSRHSRSRRRSQPNRPSSSNRLRPPSLTSRLSNSLCLAQLLAWPRFSRLYLHSPDSSSTGCLLP